MREGLWVLWRDARLRALAASAGIRYFFGGAFATLYTFYVVRELGVTPLVYGVLVTMGGAGALLGSFVAARASHRCGQGKALIGAMLIDSLLALFIPLAAGPYSVALLSVSQLIGDCGAVVYSINEVSLRQTIVPERLLGRVNASMHLLTVVLGLIGAVLAGVLSGFIGVRPTLFIGACGMLGSFVCLLFSPIRKLG
jgi:MFS family permease